MSKYVKVTTSNGSTGYTIDEYKGQYSVGKGHRGFFATPSNIGKARTFEDAVVLCKVEASRNGTVRSVEVS